jgi:predicted ATPase
MYHHYMDREAQILASAKRVMDNFFIALGQHDVELSQIGLCRTIQAREPQAQVKSEDFKFKILANAPLKNQDYIIAEKKSW